MDTPTTLVLAFAAYVLAVLAALTWRVRREPMPARIRETQR